VTWGLIRVGIVVVAGLAVAWLAFSVHVSDLQARGEDTLVRVRQGTATQKEVAQAERDLRDADRHNPDLTPMTDLGYLLQATAGAGPAFELALLAVREEPENVQSWTLLYLASPTAASAARAKLGVQRLNPWLGDHLPKPPES